MLAKNLGMRILRRFHHTHTTLKSLLLLPKCVPKSRIHVPTPPIKQFVFEEMRRNQIEIYRKFYDNQYNINDHGVVGRILKDITSRLSNKSVLNIKDFGKSKISLQLIRKEGEYMIQDKNILPQRLYWFVINYIEALHELLKLCDPVLTKSYHTLFAKDFINEICRNGINTRLFFTFEDLNMGDMIYIRPICFYPVYIPKIPQFNHNILTYKKGPLIPTKYLLKTVEGNQLDPRETFFHDIGHSHVMNRQDQWLFDTSNVNPIALIEEWVRNKDWYVAEYSKLDDPLRTAVELYLFDIVHDRGYQFYLPILKQQISARKNLENIKTKIIRGNFNEKFDKSFVAKMDAARDWLLDLTDRLLIRNNLDNIAKYQTEGYLIKRYLPVETCSGIPIRVVINKNGKIIVHFSYGDHTKMTSIFEIELLAVNIEHPVFDSEKVKNINDILNGSDSIELDVNANIVNGQPNTKINTGEFKLKSIEIFKLERVLYMGRNVKKTNFSITLLPQIYEVDSMDLIDNKKIRLKDGLILNLCDVSIEKRRRSSINLIPNTRFIPELLLRDSYIKYSETKFPIADPYVKLDNGIELGIIDTRKHIEISKAVSGILSRSIEDAKDINGGYLPEKIVTEAQKKYVSPHAISYLWSKHGYRFVLSRKVAPTIREIIATALIANSKDTLFFLTTKYNCLRYATIMKDVDLNMLYDEKNRWFDKFSMAPIKIYKPPRLNQLANFAVDKNYRGLGLGKFFIEEIVKNYAVNSPISKISHSQPLICGDGLFQIADPSWKKYMSKIGFKLRPGAETFFIDREWSPLEPVIINGKKIGNEEFNNMFGMPQIYDDIDPISQYAITERIPHVIKLAKSGYAKLQYYQLLYFF